MQQPESKKSFVKSKFSSISSRYDLLNSVLSFQVDRYWRFITTRELRMFSTGSILDLCAGTMPLSLELVRQKKERTVLAIDFCEDMLRAGKKTLCNDRRFARILPVCGDGEQIPAASDSVWGVTVAFGVRSLARTQQGLCEMHRVLKKSGKLLILEFSRPKNSLVKPLYTFYLHRILPKIAGLVSGDKEAYEYLASSIDEFYEPTELMSMMKKAGFAEVHCRPLTFGIVTLYTGVK